MLIKLAQIGSIKFEFEVLLALPALIFFVVIAAFAESRL